MGNENATLTVALNALQQAVEEAQRQTSHAIPATSALPEPWPADYFHSTAGALAGEPFDRGPQGALPEPDAS
jgi:hypothetical protein